MGQRSSEGQLSYEGLDSEALALLRELKPMLEAQAGELAEQFYRSALEFEEIRAFLHDEETKQRFLDDRRRYLLSLAETDFGPDYREARRLDGQRQAAVGLGSGWTSRLASLHASLLTPLIVRHFRSDKAKAARALRGLASRLTLDVGHTLEAYVEHREQGLAFMAKELARERRKLQQDLREQGVTLREATARAQAAEELVSFATLVAGIAHEIGTPMSVIQGHAKILEREVESEDGAWRLRTIQEQIARITNIIQTLLTMAHPHRGDPETIDLTALLAKSIDFVSERLARGHIQVKPRLTPGALVSGDRERLQQLFLNLLLNAADAMSEGGELRVELSQAGETTVVEVVDNGCGIGAQDFERIFEPFFTTKEAGQGNGLGLMVCRGIVSDHGGEIAVESQLGEGSRFTIHLPAAPPAPPPAQETPSDRFQKRSPRKV